MVIFLFSAGIVRSWTDGVGVGSAISCLASPCSERARARSVSSILNESGSDGA